MRCFIFLFYIFLLVSPVQGDSDFQNCESCRKSQNYFIKAGKNLLCVEKLTSKIPVRKVYTDCSAFQKEPVTKRPHPFITAAPTFPPYILSTERNLEKFPSRANEEPKILKIPAPVTITPPYFKAETKVTSEKIPVLPTEPTSPRTSLVKIVTTTSKPAVTTKLFIFNHTRKESTAIAAAKDAKSETMAPYNSTILPCAGERPLHRLNLTLNDIPGCEIKNHRVFLFGTRTRFVVHHSPGLIVRLMRTCCNQFILAKRHVMMGGANAKSFVKNQKNNPMANFSDTCLFLTNRCGNDRNVPRSASLFQENSKGNRNFLAALTLFILFAFARFFR